MVCVWKLRFHGKNSWESAARHWGGSPSLRMGFSHFKFHSSLDCLFLMVFTLTTLIYSLALWVGSFLNHWIHRQMKRGETWWLHNSCAIFPFLKLMTSVFELKHKSYAVVQQMSGCHINVVVNPGELSGKMSRIVYISRNSHNPHCSTGKLVGIATGWHIIVTKSPAFQPFQPFI